MSTDYAAKEREFLDSLKADTGRDLSEWMAAIRAQALPHRNDIIDWLRQQGFMFSRASWLERIHNNAGRPIYADQPPTRRPAPRQPPRPFPRANSIPFGTALPGPYPGAAAPTPPPAAPPAAAPPTPPAVAVKPMSVPALVVNRPFAPAAAPAPAPAVAPLPTVTSMPPPVAEPAATSAPRPPAARPPAPYAPPPPAAPSPGAASAPETVADVLAKAKAFRPLAQYMLREIDKAVPGAAVSVHDGLVSLGNPREFAVILASPKDVRLGLDLGDRQPEATLVRAKIPGASPRITHMMILTDVRQLDAAFADLVRAADRSAKAGSAA